MITLIEKWKNENADTNKIYQEINFIIKATKNGLNLFMTESTDSNEIIKYCVPCDDNTDTYGRIPGICFSEPTAHDAICETLCEYSYLLVPWIKNDSETVDLCLQTSFPICFTTDESGVQKESYDVMIVFSKCNNRIGFCIKAVIPLLNYKRGDKE